MSGAMKTTNPKLAEKAAAMSLPTMQEILKDAGKLPDPVTMADSILLGTLDESAKTIGLSDLGFGGSQLQLGEDESDPESSTAPKTVKQKGKHPVLLESKPPLAEMASSCLKMLDFRKDSFSSQSYERLKTFLTEELPQCSSVVEAAAALFSRLADAKAAESSQAMMDKATDVIASTGSAAQSLSKTVTHQRSVTDALEAQVKLLTDAIKKLPTPQSVDNDPMLKILLKNVYLALPSTDPKAAAQTKILQEKQVDVIFGTPAKLAKFKELLRVVKTPTDVSTAVMAALSTN